MESWYYLRKNKVIGPIALSAMKEVIIDAKSCDQILLRRDPLKQWYRLSDLSRFKSRNERLSLTLTEECKELYSLYKSIQTEKQTSPLCTKHVHNMNLQDIMEWEPEDEDEMDTSDEEEVVQERIDKLERELGEHQDALKKQMDKLGYLNDAAPQEFN